MIEANLGLASTAELIAELHARAEVADTIGESWPKYTTVGGESADSKERGDFGMPGIGRIHSQKLPIREFDAGRYWQEDAALKDPENKMSEADRFGLYVNAPGSEQARRILMAVAPEVLNHFIERNREYGESANELGMKGQYADINRKVIKLKRYLWDDVPVVDGAESIEVVAGELIGHLLILIDQLKGGY